MNVLEALRLAVGGLLGNRLRSGLTMLGILIGVGAVVLLVAVGNGASASVQSQIQGLGSNLLIVSPQSSRNAQGVSQGFGSANTLTYDDMTALNDQKTSPDIVAAVPSTQRNAQMTYTNQNWSTEVTGSTAKYPLVRDYKMASGSFFTDADVSDNSRVVVLGQTVVDNLFAGQEPVGQTVKINRQNFRVVGVFASKGAGGLANQDDTAVVPITSAWNYLSGGRNQIQNIYVQASSSNSTSDASSEVTQVLLSRHHISDPANADFRVLSQADILATATQITGILTILLGAIAAISLVVGGIGIMNIMLVTVTERTREIGIRKAIGANHRDVLLQFLIESMFLSGTGGVLGIGAGILLSMLLPHVVSQLPTPVVSPSSVALAFGVSVGIGIFFGIYPANRAARLSPIQALRYE
ncbi:MAG: ABC transporter permease [Candidatus Dormiibacterota bacterium]